MSLICLGEMRYVDFSVGGEVYWGCGRRIRRIWEGADVLFVGLCSGSEDMDGSLVRSVDAVVEA
jgi:hypothetical protein